MSQLKLTSEDEHSRKLDKLREAVTANPLVAAPSALQPGIWRLWACHQHLIPTPLPIAGSLGVWVREHGLHEDDAAAILSRLMHPAKMGSFRFASDLMTELATQATAAIERRKNEAENAARRGGQSTPEARDAVRRLLDGFGGTDGN